MSELTYKIKPLNWINISNHGRYAKVLTGFYMVQWVYGEEWWVFYNGDSVAEDVGCLERAEEVAAADWHRRLSEYLICL